MTPQQLDDLRRTIAAQVLQRLLQRLPPERHGRRGLDMRWNEYRNEVIRIVDEMLVMYESGNL